MFFKLEIKFKTFISSRTDPSAVVYSHNQTLKSSENKHTIVPNMDEFHKSKVRFCSANDIKFKNKQKTI